MKVPLKAGVIIALLVIAVPCISFLFFLNNPDDTIEKGVAVTGFPLFCMGILIAIHHYEKITKPFENRKAIRRSLLDHEFLKEIKRNKKFRDFAKEKIKEQERIEIENF